MRARIKKKVAMLMAVATCLATMAIGSGTALAAGSPFVDVSDGDWFAPSVNAMASGGLVAGVGNNRFAPNNTMSIAAFSTIMCRAMGLDTNSNDAYWGYGAVRQCLSKGYISQHGTTITGVAYDQGITREEAIAGMTKLDGLEYKPGDKTWKLTDIPDYREISDKYALDVLKAYNMGLCSGVDDSGKFSPKSVLTRAQVAQLFYNVDITTAKPVTPVQPDVPDENSKYKAPVGFVFSDSLWKTHEKATYSDGQTYTKEYVALMQDNEKNGMRSKGSAHFADGTYEIPITVNFGFNCTYYNPTTGNYSPDDERGPTHIKITPEVNAGNGWVPVAEYIFDESEGTIKNGCGTFTFTIPFDTKRNIRFALDDGYSMNTGYVLEGAMRGITGVLQYDKEMTLNPNYEPYKKSLGMEGPLPLE